MQKCKSKNNNCLESGISDFVVKVFPGAMDSWQGQMKHVQSGRAYCFNSYPEMVKIIQAELEQCGNPREEADLRTWPSTPAFRLIRRPG